MMFGTRWQMVRVFGIPIYVDASWLVILALLTLSFGSGFPAFLHEYYPSFTPHLLPYQYWLMGLITALVFFACILLHELGHAVVARARGMPIRGITLFLFGGVAEIGEEPPSAGTEFWMAVAGPAVSLVLAGLCGLLTIVGYQSRWPPPAVVVLGYLAVINSLVLAFNLVPAFPLDGGRVLRSVLWGVTHDLGRATRWASRAGQAFAMLLIAWGVYQLFTGNWLGGIWTGLIGMFLNSAARSSYQDVLARRVLQGDPVRAFMNPAPVIVPPSMALGRWVEEFVYRYHHRAFPVVADGRLVGLITTQVLGQIPHNEWPLHTVAEVMLADLGAVSIATDADAFDALRKMQRTGSSRLLVVDGDRLVGMVSLKDLLHFLNLKLELEGGDESRPRHGQPPTHTYSGAARCG